MGGCQNYGPFLGTINIRCRIVIGIPKRDDHFDNHPDRHTEVLWVQVLTHPRTFEPKEFKFLGARVYGFRVYGF